MASSSSIAFKIACAERKKIYYDAIIKRAQMARNANAEKLEELRNAERRDQKSN
jgi:hypothetical protein